LVSIHSERLRIAIIKKGATWASMEPKENPFTFIQVEQIKAMMDTKLIIVEETAVDLGFEANDSLSARVE
jgi:hypothetical protein